MADVIGQHEISDNFGSTVSFSGTATTTVQSVPAVAGNAISEALLTVSGSNVQISFDNGTTFFNVPRNGNLSWDVKGEIAQVQIQTSGGSRSFDLILNLEEQ